MPRFSGLEEQYLETLRRENCGVTVFLMNGFQMRGTVVGYDQNAILVWSDGKQNMIYKHAISTITPLTPIQIDTPFEG